MNTLKVECPHCQTKFTVAKLRAHYCGLNNDRRIEKQDWWVIVDKARVAAGLPEMIYGYDVVYINSRGETKDFHFAGTEAAARRAAKLKSLWKETLSVTPYTYAKYCAAFGVPGMRM